MTPEEIRQRIEHLSEEQRALEGELRALPCPGPGEAHRAPTPSTIDIRIACYVTPDGRWCASGGSAVAKWSVSAEESAHEGLMDWVDDPPPTLCYITARVEIPSVPVPLEVAGKVDDAQD